MSKIIFGYVGIMVFLLVMFYFTERPRGGGDK